jgi:hypothetical protein
MLGPIAVGSAVAVAFALWAAVSWLEVRRAYREGWSAGRLHGAERGYRSGVDHGYRRGLADRVAPLDEPALPPLPPMPAAAGLAPTLPSIGERQTFKASRRDLLRVSEDARRAAESYPEIPASTEPG